MAADPLYELRAAVHAAAGAVRGGDGPPPAQARVERPKRAGQGDYSTNVAMLLAPSLGAAPREIAERVGAALADSLKERLSGWAVAGPGFINLTLSDHWYRETTRGVLEAGPNYGGGGAQAPERVLLEFVSANPTGPMVAANGQPAAYGDALARILAHHGHQVATEYYVNDAGSQIVRLGESVLARAAGAAVPEGGYQGDYVVELAEQIPDVQALSAPQAGDAAVQLLLAQIEATLRRYGVHYDQFFSERTLHQGDPAFSDPGAGDRRRRRSHLPPRGRAVAALDDLRRREGPCAGRSDGEPTYLASDLAYLLEKLERGVERQIIPVGSDHHGYVARMKAALAALGGDPERLEMPLLQFVHLVEGTQRAAMSKRRGEFITLDDLLDEIGVDVTRYFMLQRSHDRTVDLDLDLAKRESRENPVYYIQYAHARIVTMLGKLDPGRREAALAPGADWGQVPLELAERTLDQGAGGVPGRGGRGGRAARSAPDRRLRARAGPGVHRLLPRLQGRRGRAREHRVVPDRARPGGPADDRAGARPARGGRAGHDVAAAAGAGRGSGVTGEVLV